MTIQEDTTTSPSIWSRMGSLFDATQKDKPKTSKVKKRRHLSDSRRLDYRYAEDDPFLFIKGKSVWTGVILGTTSDDFASYLEEEQQVQRNKRIWSALSVHFANHHTEDELRGQIITRYVPVDVSRWETQYLNHCWNPSQLFLDLVRGKVSPHLAESTPERRQYLLIRLGDFDAPVQLDPLSKILGVSAGVAEEVFNSRDLDPFRTKARGVHTLLSGMGAVPMERVDLAWLIRKTLMGHFPADNGRSVERTRPWRGGFFDEIVNAEIENFGDYVRIRNPHPEKGGSEYSYTTTVTLNYESPRVGYRYTGAWGKQLRSMSRPVDVSWRFTILSADEWRRRSEKVIKRIDDENTERAKAGARYSEAFEQKRALSIELEDQNEIQPQPVLISQQRLTFSAPTAEELTTVFGELQGLFGDDVTIERASGVQGFLLEEQLPGDMTVPKVRFGGLGRMVISDLTGGVDDGPRWTDLDALTFARLDSSPSVGDEVEYTSSGAARGWRGGPIGYTESNGSVVHFDPVVQMARNGGAGVIIVGSSGGGKSSLSLMLFFWASEAGVQCIVLDPKNDFERFAYYLAFGAQVTHEGFDEEATRGTLGGPDSKFQPVNPAFWEQTSLVHLGDGAPGMLDPWAITDNYNDGENAAREILDLVFSNAKDKEILDVAFQNMRLEYEKQPDGVASLSELATFLGSEMEHYASINADDDTSQGDRMEARDREVAVRRVHDALVRAAGRQYGRLMFARSASTKPFTISDKRRVIITMFGLALPDDKAPVEEWDESTRDGAAAMLTVIRQLNRVFTASRDEESPWQKVRGIRPRLLFIDEAYFVTAFKAGRRMLNIFLRQGRSRFFGVVFISQQAKDINKLNEEASGDDDASTNQFPTKFVFRQGGISEAKDAMRLLRPSLEQADPESMNALSQQLLKPAQGGRMATGRCVMSDADGRVSMVSVDRMFVELIAAGETNPAARTEAQSVDAPANGLDWTIDTSGRDMLRTGVISTEVGEIREALQRYEYGEYESVFDL